MEFRLLIVSSCIALLVFRLSRVGRRPKGYPPGPPTLPVLGNIHQMAHRDVHKQFQKWAEEYGPIYSLILGTKTMIVLSSDTAVKELLDRRSGIYSDRQDMYFAQTLCSGGMRVLMMRYGPTWRAIRKLLHALLNVQAARSYVPYQMLENKQMLFEILKSPERLLEHIRRYTNSLTTTMTFGWRTPTLDDPQLVQLFAGFDKFSEVNTTTTAILIEFFPFLRRFPDIILPAQAIARQLHKVEKKLYLSHWLKCKNSIKDGTPRPCFCVNLAKAQASEGFSDEQAAYISGTILEAGSDTTSSTLYGFAQAMLLFPEVQKKAQDEIDRVIGADRLPTMDDEQNLQYIRGCVKETLRWMPTTVLGAVPHAVTKDDEYMGYHIPKGAAVLNNVYTINMDPKRFPEPRRFNPDRYKDDFQTLFEAASNSDPSKRDQFTFGAGRRICPGLHVAERSLFLGISRMLWAFDFKHALDKVTGEKMVPDPEELTPGFVCMPVPFQVSVTARSPSRALIIENEWQNAQRNLDPDTNQWTQHALEDMH